MVTYSQVLGIRTRTSGGDVPPTSASIMYLLRKPTKSTKRDKPYASQFNRVGKKNNSVEKNREINTGTLSNKRQMYRGFYKIIIKNTTV